MIDEGNLKTIIPSVSHKILPRRRIVEIINNSSLQEIVYLVAPYGCGKTMSIICWLHTYNKKAAWISLSENENSPLHFWANMTSAISRLLTQPQKAEDILQNLHFIENPRAFFRKALKNLPLSLKEKILVIDNFKFINNSILLQEIKATLSEMLGSWRIIVISRSEMPHIFNDFMLRNHLRLITLSELNFSIDEMNKYFLMNGLTVERKDLIQIHEDTDGWPVAINVILTISHSETVKYSNIAKGYVMNYFEDKIWNQLNKKVKTFLLKTSILDKLTTSICHYVTDIEETHTILRSLYANGIFTSTLETRDTYSYQRLFRDFLLDKLYHSELDVNSLYVKVGWWFYERNESISSLLCFYKAHDLYGINMAFKKIKPTDMGNKTVTINLDKDVQICTAV